MSDDRHRAYGAVIRHQDPKSIMPFTCKICGSPLSPIFKAQVLGKYEARYNACATCGFLCAQEPHWLAEAHSSAIASTDTGLVARNIASADKLAVILYFLMGKHVNGLYVDMAGGYGLLTRLMRDYGFDFYWSDPYCQNLMARGFDYIPAMGACRAVTALEVLEHTEDPLSFVQGALRYGQADTLILTTELYEGSPPLPDQWRYYSFETGQHISFFQKRTLDVMARKLGLHLSSSRCIHVFSKSKVNELLLRACTGKLNGLAARWVQRRLATRILSDHNALVDQLRRSKP